MRALQLASLALFALMAGCRGDGTLIGVNSVLEIDMQLPSGGPTDKPYALVEVQPGPIPADFDPNAVIGDGLSFQLDQNVCAPGEDPCNLRLSVTRGDAALEAIHIRVNLCNSPDCNDPAFPEDARAPYYLFEVQRPFYQGYRTFWHPTRGPFATLNEDAFATQPTGPLAERRIIVDRCEVACELNMGDTPLPDLGYCQTDPECRDGLNCRGLHACE